MSKFVLGCDPGAKGAIAVLDADTGRLERVFDMPTVEIMVGGKAKTRISPEILAEELRAYAGSTAYVEKVGAMPGQGVTSMFAFGEAYGLLRGVLSGLGIAYTLMPPAVWKKAMKVPEGKDGSRAMAAQMFPYAAGEFKRVKDDGRAEASLIARAGLNEITGR